MKRRLLSLFGVLLLTLQSGCAFVSPVNGQGSAGERRTILIDPGHGGVDGGAVGVSGVIEKELNLSISLRLKPLLIFLGYHVIMTRETDMSIHDPEATTIRQMKSSDLRNRLALASMHPEAAYLSIHQNNFQDSRQSGMCFYYSPNDPDSQRLATVLRDTLLSSLQPDNRRQIKQADKNLFILFHAENPAVLVECGFLSNPDEEQRLTQQEYQTQICIMLASALSVAKL